MSDAFFQCFGKCLLGSGTMCSTALRSISQEIV